MISLPPGMRVTFTVYMKSSEGLTSAINVSGGTKIPENLASINDAAISASNEIADVDDFQLMTDDEITEYLEEQEE